MKGGPFCTVAFEKLCILKYQYRFILIFVQSKRGQMRPFLLAVVSDFDCVMIVVCAINRSNLYASLLAPISLRFL